MSRASHLTAWDFWILRVIAVYHLAKAVFFFALGFGLLHFVHHDIAQFITDYIVEPLHFDSDSPYLKWLLEEVSTFTPHNIRFISYVVFVYGTIFAIEGVGLYMRKRWAEYMVVIVVTSLLPFELWAIYHKFEWWKIALVVGNLLVVAFLVRQLVVGAREHRKRQAL